MPADPTTVVVRFHSHMRLSDHPALAAAVDRADQLVPVYVADGRASDWPPGPNQMHWRIASLRELSVRLANEELSLVVRQGAVADELLDVAGGVDADAVYWNRRCRPDQRRRDEAAAEALVGEGIDVETFDSQLLHDPDAIETTSGGPYHVFTPFWRKFLKKVDVPSPRPTPPLRDVGAPGTDVEGLNPAELGDEAAAATDFDAYWTPGEVAARERLESFAGDGVEGYPKGRDDLETSATSRLSPRLQHGELSPRQVWEAVAGADGPSAEAESARDAFLRQIVWREFSYHLLHHYPETTTQPLREKFRDFDWRDEPEMLERWQQGQTGYPIVDAGMRQMLQTGWMHNRARMIVASFLTKDLRQHWLRGAEWFWHHLVDADLANNTMGWQWAAGSGADAQPFFRIFNPVSQGDRHDPEGAYVRQFVPELADLPAQHIHEPWEAPAEVLEGAGVELGENYPKPIVDHSQAREEALEAWRRIK